MYKSYHFIITNNRLDVLVSRRTRSRRSNIPSRKCALCLGLGAMHLRSCAPPWLTTCLLNSSIVAARARVNIHTALLLFYIYMY